jgi:hypothetical protein
MTVRSVVWGAAAAADCAALEPYCRPVEAGACREGLSVTETCAEALDVAGPSADLASAVVASDAVPSAVASDKGASVDSTGTSGWASEARSESLHPGDWCSMTIGCHPEEDMVAAAGTALPPLEAARLSCSVASSCAEA